MIIDHEGTSSKYGHLCPLVYKFLPYKPLTLPNLMLYTVSLIRYDVYHQYFEPIFGIYYMPFARSQVLLWKFLYQNQCNWFVGCNSIFLSPHYSVSRSPQLSYQRNICKQCYFNPFVLICWSTNVRPLKYTIVWS